MLHGARESGGGGEVGQGGDGEVAEDGVEDAGSAVGVEGHEEQSEADGSDETDQSIQNPVFPGGFFMYFSTLKDVEQAKGPHFLSGADGEVLDEVRILEELRAVERGAPLPVVDVIVGLQVDCGVSEDDGGAQPQSAVFLELEGVEAFAKRQVGVAFVQAVQFTVLAVLIVVDQETVVSQREDGFVERNHIHLTEVESGVVILAVEGCKARRIRLHL